MGFFGPKTGAGDGQKEWKAQTRKGTGSHWKAEEKDRNKIIARERKEEKRIRKLEKEAAKAEKKEKGGFFY